MTENKRFEVWKTIGSFHCWYIEDVIDDKVVVDNIMHKYEADRLCDNLNELFDENEQLKQSLKNKMESDDYWEQKAKERVNKLEKENEQLKKELNTFKPVVFQDTTNNGTIVLYAKEYGDVE